MDPFVFTIAEAAEKGLWFYCSLTNEYKTPQQIREMYGKLNFRSSLWRVTDLDRNIRVNREEQWRLEAESVKHKNAADRLSAKRTQSLMETEAMAVS